MLPARVTLTPGSDRVIPTKVNTLVMVSILPGSEDLKNPVLLGQVVSVTPPLNPGHDASHTLSTHILLRRGSDRQFTCTHMLLDMPLRGHSR